MASSFSTSMPSRVPSASPYLSGDQGAADNSSRRRMRNWLAGILAAWCVWSSLLFVDETQFVIVETLGRISAVYDVVDTARSDRGLHAKWPWPIGIARVYDRRQQVFDPPAREMFSQDKKNLIVASYITWRIAPSTDAKVPFDERPVVKFFRGLGDPLTAESRLDARLRALLAIEVGRIPLSDLLVADSSDAAPHEARPLERISTRLLEQLRQQPDEALSYSERFGIELVDAAIARINLPEGNRLAVYERMRSERERTAERYRATGRAEKLRIESLAQRQAGELLAKAAAEAERVRGKGEAEALAILGKAREIDPELYEFQQALSVYAKILNDRTTLVLSTASPLFQWLTGDKAPRPRALSPGTPPAAEPVDKNAPASTGGS